MPQPTDTTVILARPATLPAVAEPTSSLVFSDAGKHHVDDRRTLHVQSLNGGNIASFADGEWIGVYHGTPSVAAGGDQ